ncbi:hypothetical protein [Streptomyces anulatus]|uniref:hypothetical protein n=1 Tax=Streptomyces anulatus TaxID=1892 RepID=UPI003417DF37
MNLADLGLDLGKVLDTLEWVEEYFNHSSEARAALHTNEKVRYPPLAVQVQASREMVARMLKGLAMEVEFDKVKVT